MRFVVSGIEREVIVADEGSPADEHASHQPDAVPAHPPQRFACRTMRSLFSSV